MSWPSGETLALIEHYLPDRLISRPALANARAIAERLPEAIYSYYLECRLDDSPQVDFLVSMVAGSGRDVWAGQQRERGSAEPLLATAPWRPIRHFLHRWAEPDTLLHTHAPMIWLEFDGVQAALPDSPLPGICFCLDPDYVETGPSFQPSSRLSLPVYQALADEALTLLYERPLSAQTRQRLQVCYEQLPAGGRLIHISAMLARQPPVLKVYAAVPRNDLPTYLRRIAWPGSHADLAEIVAKFFPALCLLFVDLTLGDAIAPRLGLACSQVHLHSRAQSDPGWGALLDLSVAEGFCTPQKRAGLLNWPGAARHPFHGHNWPVRLHRWLDLKLVYQPEQPLEVKAYLGFMPTFSIF